ncbi:FeoB-associated Cys-rich membrane protein [Intestinimonas sp.]|uniref:FeoB-associated Cys-rich membrane protein n=1 Tax=Intestinimonas sp. TaxID=1965293 RepID=UPI003AAC13E9
MTPATIIVGLLLLAGVTLLVRHMVRRHKAGSGGCSACGGSCSSCCGGCHASPPKGRS